MTLRPVKVSGARFVGAVQELGGTERDGKRLWARIVSRLRGSAHGLQTAYAESLHASQLAEVAAGKPTQFKHLKEGDWELITGAASAFAPAS